MTEFVKKEDLHIINRALNNGSDVKIQLTKDGYRITEDTMKVLKRVAISQEKWKNKKLYLRRKSGVEEPKRATDTVKCAGSPLLFCTERRRRNGSTERTV